MDIFEFEWEILATPSLRQRVLQGAGVDITDDGGPDLIPMLSAVLARVGGLPISVRRYSSDDRTALGGRLLTSALQRTARRLGATPPATGHLLEESSRPELATSIVQYERVSLHSADAHELEALPGIGPTLAERIVNERAGGGPFTSYDSLAERVHGIGDELGDTLRYITSLEPIEQAWMRVESMDLEHLIGFLTDRAPGETPAERLEAALHLTAMTCAEPTHPALIARAVVEPPAAVDVSFVDADWVGLVADAGYYGVLPEMLGSATTSIEVCMFHIAFPTDDHPTHDLLDALVDAAARGVDVRVLIDADRPQDPYLSSVINARAKDFLSANGVACKFDAPDRLLHSKFVIIDRDLCVIGSHNWSAGSYFHFDDLSLAISSAPLATSLGARFDMLWSAS